MSKKAAYYRTARPESDMDQQISSVRRNVRLTPGETLEEFMDNGVSGNTADRPGLAGLLAFCEKNPGMVVFVESADRLARSPTTYAVIEKLLRSAGAEVRVTR